ncbi:MAG: hypothetical protein AB1806_13095 [Acidobacteriota bacterium]
MRSWGRAIGFGVLAWFIPFAVAFLVFPLHEPARPVFESIMAVAVTGTAVILALAYLKRAQDLKPSQGLILGALWLAISILIDAPLMLLGGPMQMSVGAYLGDIGLTYVCIPLVTWGLASSRTIGTPAA